MKGCFEIANLKRNMIELVKEVKEGEIETVKYLTPVRKIPSH